MPRTAAPKSSAQVAAEVRDEAIREARKSFRQDKRRAEDKFNSAMADAWMEFSKSATNGTNK